jgi:RNA polymerase sigma-70 factor (ECF subfamily)
MILLVLPDIDGDDHLLRQASQYNKEAVRLIYERYFPPIHQFIRLRVNNREQAKDICADVFLDFIRALQGNNPPRKNLRAWLFQVARYKVYKHYGKEKQLPQTALKEWMPTQHDNNPESIFVDQSRIAYIRKTLNLMVAEQQEVIILRFGQGLSLQETADIMGKSVSAIKSLQFRAIRNLRELVDAGEKESYDGTD